MIVSEDLIWITVKTIANYYEVKLADVAHNLSVDEYKMIRADIQKLRESAERGKFYWNYDFYLDFGWMNTGLAQLAPKNWQVVSAFFSAAHKYFDAEQNKLNMDWPEQELAKAITRIDNSVCGKYTTINVPTNKRAMPIDYDKTIEDTVTKVANYYDKKLKKLSGKTSYRNMVVWDKSLCILRKGADVKNNAFYAEYCWLTPGMELNRLDDELWQTMIKFFAVAREYLDYKQHNLNMTWVDQELAVMVKQVNLKLGNTLFESLRDMFTPVNGFMSRRSM